MEKYNLNVFKYKIMLKNKNLHLVLLYIFHFLETFSFLIWFKYVSNCSLKRHVFIEI